MKSMKKTLVILTCILVLLCIIGVFFFLQSWPHRFTREFDRFFGEDNWHLVSQETKDSIIYSRYISSRNLPSQEVPGRYHNWYLEVGPQNDLQLWQISDHTLRINRDRYGFLSFKRLSPKQALVQELMEISHIVATEDVLYTTIAPLLTSEQLQCMDVVVMYRNGNPPKTFYTDLWQEEWFCLEGITAENYLRDDLYDFYIYVRAFDYRVDNLDDAARADLLQKLPLIADALTQRFGTDADFEIYLDEEHRLNSQ